MTSSTAGTLLALGVTNLSTYGTLAYTRLIPIVIIITLFFTAIWVIKSLYHKHF